MNHATVRVPVATLWAAPERTRPSDAAALRDEPDIGAWIAAMTPDEQTGGDVVTQLLLGDPVFVDEVRPDGWSRVVAPAQPAAGLDPRGYPGWVRTAQLTAAAAVPGDEPLLVEPVLVEPLLVEPLAVEPLAVEPLVVDAVVTALRYSPGGQVAVPGVVLGTFLTPAGAVPGAGPVAAAGAGAGAGAGAAAGAGAGRGVVAGGWVPVRVPGRAEPLWAPAGDLAAVPPAPPTGEEVLAVARRLRGAVYVWGGLSSLGIDCSGLVHLVWRRLGVRLPRDAHEQSATTTAVPAGTARPGDLYFFARPGRPAHHVGIVVAAAHGTAPGRMLHASPGTHQVVEEPMPPGRAETLAGVHRP